MHNAGFEGCLQGQWRQSNAYSHTTLAREAILLAPGDFQPRANLALALNSMGLADEAADAYRKALAIAPAATDIARQFYELLVSQRRYAEAIGVLREVFGEFQEPVSF